MVPINPVNKASMSGPADKPTSHQGLALEDLTHTQNEMLCVDIKDEVLNTVVGCDRVRLQRAHPRAHHMCECHLLPQWS